MGRPREDAVHQAVREFLQNAGWRLIAGQYPNGSDDLPPLNIKDPVVARDNSPDPRRHSSNKFVPDLVACKGHIMLIIEMKPGYSSKDEEKLNTILTQRIQDLLSAIKDLITTRKVELPVSIQDLVFVPCLGFGALSAYVQNPDFCYFKVSTASPIPSVIFEGNSVVPDLRHPNAIEMRTAEETFLAHVTQLDWDCPDAKTQYLTHSIHRYSGKFIPQIAKQAIELLSRPGELVLDPYCGSGTTLLEGALHGRYTLGVDLNPLAVLISQVKTTPVEKKVLEIFVQSFHEWAQPLLRRLPQGDSFGTAQMQLDLFNTLASWEEIIQKVHQDPRWQDEWYRKWFQEDVLLELIVLHDRILAEPNQVCRNIGLVAFSDILRKCSNAHGSYPNVMFDRDKVVNLSAFPLFLERLNELVQAVSKLELALADKPLPRIILGNARCLDIPDCSIDAIVTHPPYIASIPYAEYGLLSLKWLGYNPKELDKELTGGRRQSRHVAEQFKVGFADMMREAYRVLKPGRMLFMLVGDPVVKGKRINLAAMAVELAQDAGFVLAATHYRNGINRRANLMGHESLLFFRKS